MEEEQVKEWELLIIKAENGFVLEGMGRDEQVMVAEQIETGDESKDQAELYKKLFWQIREYFGYYWSKHNGYNLDIKIVDQEGKEVE